MAWTPITDHASLKTAIASWLNRTDLTDVIDQFILNAESKFLRDPRVTILRSSSVEISAATHDLSKSTFKGMESWDLSGPQAWGPMILKSIGEISREKGLRGGQTGPPEFVAIVESDATFTAHFAPEPDQAYDSTLSYWAALPALSAGANWLVGSYPDIYLKAALVESAPYLKDDARIAVWAGELEAGLQALETINESKRFSGGPLSRTFDPIGG